MEHRRGIGVEEHRRGIRVTSERHSDEWQSCVVLELCGGKHRTVKKDRSYVSSGATPEQHRSDIGATPGRHRSDTGATPERNIGEGSE